MTDPAALLSLARAARLAQRALAAAPAEARSQALRHLAGLLEEREGEILAANAQDLAAASDLAPALKKRLGLDRDKLATLAEGCRALAAGDDPVGRPLRRTLLDEGLVLSQVQSPVGVLLIILRRPSRLEAARARQAQEDRRTCTHAR